MEIVSLTQDSYLQSKDKFRKPEIKKVKEKSEENPIKKEIMKGPNSMIWTNINEKFTTFELAKFFEKKSNHAYENQSKGKLINNFSKEPTKKIMNLIPENNKEDNKSIKANEYPENSSKKNDRNLEITIKNNKNFDIQKVYF